MVADMTTFPVGFRFYVPNPVLSACRKRDNALKKTKGS